MTETESNNAYEYFISFDICTLLKFWNYFFLNADFNSLLHNVLQLCKLCKMSHFWWLFHQCISWFRYMKLDISEIKKKSYKNYTNWFNFKIDKVKFISNITSTCFKSKRSMNNLLAFFFFFNYFYLQSYRNSPK